MNALLGIILGGALFVPLSVAVGPLPAVLLAGALLVAIILGDAWRVVRENDTEARDLRITLERWRAWDRFDRVGRTDTTRVNRLLSRA